MPRASRTQKSKNNLNPVSNSRKNGHDTPPSGVRTPNSIGRYRTRIRPWRALIAEARSPPLAFALRPRKRATGLGRSVVVLALGWARKEKLSRIRVRLRGGGARRNRRNESAKFGAVCVRVGVLAGGARVDVGKVRRGVTCRESSHGVWLSVSDFFFSSFLEFEAWRSSDSGCAFARQPPAGARNDAADTSPCIFFQQAHGTDSVLLSPPGFSAAIRPHDSRRLSIVLPR